MGEGSVSYAAFQIDLSVKFSTLWLLARLRSRRRARRCRCHSRLLAFRDSLRRHIGLATVFGFCPSRDLFAIRRLILHQRALALANKRKLRMFPVPVDPDPL